MADTLTIPLRPTQDKDLYRLLNWFACWLVLPNLPFLPMTLMGGPPRGFEILICGIVGLVVRGMNFWVRLLTFISLLVWLTVMFIAHMFNMAPSMIMSVIVFVTDIRPAVAPDYVAGAILLALTIAMASWALKLDSGFKGWRFQLYACSAIALLTVTDLQYSQDAMGSYHRLAPADAPFSSASTQAGLLGLADGKTNIMVVMVEAMGEPRDPQLKAQLDRIWMRPELASRYEVSRGQTPFYGSTTSGEMRELCHRWGDYNAITQAEPGCLPAILAAKGYQTASYHPFTGRFFDRTRWYPLIGFQQLNFEKQLERKGASKCPSVFSGACDRDVPGIIGNEMKQPGKPHFSYWLTLNSHLPVVENDELLTKDCKAIGAAESSDFPMVCRLFAIWHNTADALIAEATKPDFPPTHILIVGDHMPPFTHQPSRLKFDSENVPWILLRYKQGRTGNAPVETQSVPVPPLR